MEPVNILLVDDRPADLYALEAVLSDPTYRIFRAHSGQEAIKQLETEEFAVILMDVRMSGMDGFETAAIIKTRSKMKTIPIIFISGVFTESAAVIKGYQAGGIEYLPKPVDPVTLRSKVRYYAEIYRSRIKTAHDADVDRKLYEQNLLRVTEELKLYREQQHFALRVAHLGAWNLNPATQQLKWTEENDRIWGFGPGEFKGHLQELFARIHPDDLSFVSREFAQTANDGKVMDIKFRIFWPDGSMRWVHSKARPSFSASKKIEHIIGLSIDISERKRLEDIQGFVAEAGATLSSSLDYDVTLRNAAELMVPLFADWCILDLFENDVFLRRCAVAHADPSKRALAAKLETLIPDPSSESGVGLALRENRSVIGPDPNKGEKQLNPHIGVSKPEQERVVAELGITSHMTVLLRARDQVIGVATFVRSKGPNYTADDIFFTEKMAAIAGLAMDNARLYRKAHDAVRAREDVISTVSHDLKNPLTAIQLGSSIIERRLASQAPVESIQTEVQRIRRISRQMENLVTNLLEVSKIESGTFSVNAKQEDIRQICEQALELMSPLAAKKSIRLVLDISENCCPVLADRNRILQVYSNLVGNALKFAPENSQITLGGKIQDGSAKLWVEDQGSGIDPKEIPHIFDRFWQSKKAHATVKGGAGYGLTIVKGIINAHGGKIWCESELGKGTKFNFELPVARTENRAA